MSTYSSPRAKVATCPSTPGRAGYGHGLFPTAYSLGGALPKPRSKRRRYQPPPRPKPKPSPPWYGYVVLTPIAAGFVIIVLNYIGVAWETSNSVLWLGIGLMLVGFVLATRWR
ncbi:MAG: hypothetical protein C4318_01260 [Acidimicrobiia bacterium]